MPPKKASKPEATAATTRPKRVRAKVTAAAPAATTSTTNASSTKKRGRPAKAAGESGEPPKKRGRPSKAASSVSTTTAGKNTVGRPSKAKPAVSKNEKAPPKKRGRPPKGGETTKASRDDDAAAEQLEEELVEAVEEDEAAPDAAAAKPEERYFLMKAEQEDRFETLKSGRQFNTKFTIDDLRGKNEPEMWDGVRNHVARNVMSEMKKGDLAFFYASGGKAGRKPGITGIMEVVEEAQPDPTTHDEDAIGFVEKESDREKWLIVHVEYRKKLRNPVTLKTLQENAGDGGKLKNMHMLNSARLSVSRVSPSEWNFIVNELIAGDYEDIKSNLGLK